MQCQPGLRSAPVRREACNALFWCHLRREPLRSAASCRASRAGRKGGGEGRPGARARSNAIRASTLTTATPLPVAPAGCASVQRGWQALGRLAHIRRTPLATLHVHDATNSKAQTSTFRPTLPSAPLKLLLCSVTRGIYRWLYACWRSVNCRRARCWRQLNSAPTLRTAAGARACATSTIGRRALHRSTPWRGARQVLAVAAGRGVAPRAVVRDRASAAVPSAALRDGACGDTFARCRRASD